MQLSDVRAMEGVKAFNLIVEIVMSYKEMCDNEKTGLS